MIPGFLISIITFPGVIVHEMAHLFFCRLYGVQVHEVCYFRLGNPAGYVIHGEPAKSWHHLMIGVGPFFVNTLLGFLLALPLALDLALPAQWMIPVLGWLAISIAMHSFPSSGDAASIWSASWSKGTPIWMKLLSVPLVGFIYLLAIGSVLWLDLAYGVAVAIFLPQFLLDAIR